MLRSTGDIIYLYTEVDLRISYLFINTGSNCKHIYRVCWLYDYCKYSIFMRPLDPYPFYLTSGLHL